MGTGHGNTCVSFDRSGKFLLVTRYWESGVSVLPWNPADGPIRAHPRFIQWPEPHEIKVAFTGNPISYAVFEGRAVAYVPITIAADAPLGLATLTVKPVFQVCDDTTCLAPTPMPSDGSSWEEYEGLKVPIEIVSLETMQANPTPPPDPNIFGGFNQAVFDDKFRES